MVLKTNMLDYILKFFIYGIFFFGFICYLTKPSDKILNNLINTKFDIKILDWVFFKTAETKINQKKLYYIGIINNWFSDQIKPGN